MTFSNCGAGGATKVACEVFELRNVPQPSGVPTQVGPVIVQVTPELERSPGTDALNTAVVRGTTVVLDGPVSCTLTG